MVGLFVLLEGKAEISNIIFGIFFVFLTNGCTIFDMYLYTYDRVGDSPLIGCGLYASNDHGAAVATGKI